MTRKPLATVVFTALPVLWFIFMIIIYGTTTDSELLYLNGALYGEYFTIDQWWRLISPIFTHIGFAHLLSNMVLLVTLGRSLEYVIGTFKFFILYLLSAVGGSLAVVFFQPEVVTAGASGALFGILGFLAIHYLRRKSSRIYALGKIYSGIIIINIVYTFIGQEVSVVGHIGGFISGLILGLFIEED